MRRSVNDRMRRSAGRAAGGERGTDAALARRRRSGGRLGRRSPASFQFEILRSLAARIEVPDGDIVAGRTYPTRAAPLGLIPKLAVKHQRLSPESTFAAIEYQGTWYWVDDADYASKRVFTGLMLILNVVEKIGQPQLPVITIPTG